MLGKNDGGYKNEAQLKLLSKLESEIDVYAKNPKAYPGFVAMIDAPGGTGISA
jgi:hypothetical protein